MDKKIFYTFVFSCKNKPWIMKYINEFMFIKILILICTNFYKKQAIILNKHGYLKSFQSLLFETETN